MIFMRTAAGREGTDKEGGVCWSGSAGSLKLRHSYTMCSFVRTAPVRSLGRADCTETGKRRVSEAYVRPTCM